MAVAPALWRRAQVKSNRSAAEGGKIVNLPVRKHNHLLGYDNDNLATAPGRCLDLQEAHHALYLGSSPRHFFGFSEMNRHDFEPWRKRSCGALLFLADDADVEATKLRLLKMAADYEARAKVAADLDEPNLADLNVAEIGGEIRVLAEPKRG